LSTNAGSKANAETIVIVRVTHPENTPFSPSCERSGNSWRKLTMPDNPTTKSNQIIIGAFWGFISAVGTAVIGAGFLLMMRALQ
jgi:hypothetical protein